MATRAALLAALRRRYPWVDRLDIGPRSVVAGDCDRCGAEARLVMPCGPPPGGVGPDWALGRRCALACGPDAWCAGHETEGEQALAWLAALPPEADDVARLWWVATGEARLDPGLLGQAARRLALPLSDGDAGEIGGGGVGGGYAAEPYEFVESSRTLEDFWG